MTSFPQETTHDHPNMLHIVGFPGSLQDTPDPYRRPAHHGRLLLPVFHVNYFDLGHFCAAFGHSFVSGWKAQSWGRAGQTYLP